MKILLVSATAPEIAPFLQRIGYTASDPGLIHANFKSHELDILLTGVGIAQTSYYLGRYLNETYDLALNAGICGAFNTHLRLGEVVNITEDYFADLGAEDNDKFLSVSELGLPAVYYVRNENPLSCDLKQVRGVTVNTTHGNEQSIRKFTARLKADVESMEGAAFLWACNQQKTKCLQLRAISNYVEKRDRSKWKISEAIEALNKSLLNLVTSP